MKVTPWLNFGPKLVYFRINHMTQANLVLVLGDQLSLNNPALAVARAGTDIVLMAEVHEETHYVRHNRHKIAFILSAMRHFREQLVERGFEVIYYRLEEGVSSLEAAVCRAIDRCGRLPLRVCQPGEQRLADAFKTWKKRLQLQVTVMEDTRFLATREDFERWANARKQLRMEYFYRGMRQRYGLLLTPEGKPAGGRWNFDQQNRKGWRASRSIPARPPGNQDAITRAVIAEVELRFPDNPGQLAEFYCAVSADEAQEHFDWFCDNALGQFGTWQDAMADESPWLFHSLISMYINVGLLDPLRVCTTANSVTPRDLFGRCWAGASISGASTGC
jgi:deoxyribodipyrimidine photolyase-related protein